jgi:DNA (cytosine-5)-methyltransferase 1
LHPDEPSKAITGGARSEFLHPIEDRNLTIRECARLQTFPDDFTFCGSTSEQIQLIGNAVPPLLANQIAKSLARDLAQEQRFHDAGALLSFVPTLSDGYSPILRSVIETVNRELKEFRQPEEMLLWQ